MPGELRKEVYIARPPQQLILLLAIAGQCWLVVEDVPEPVLLKAGDCCLLPRGLPFRLATDLSLEPVHYTIARNRLAMSSEVPGPLMVRLTSLVGTSF